ncbi:unnamed protein product, partial [Meganyctiphanes norvegica]
MDAALDKIGMGLWQFSPIFTISMVQAFAAVGFINSVFINQPYESNCISTFNTSLFDIEKPNIQESNANTLSTSDTACYIYQRHDTGLLMFYDKSVFLDAWSVDSTIASEFSIHGDRNWLSPFYQMAFVIGVMIGDLGGTFSDSFGRIFTIRLATVGCTIGQLLISFSPYLSVIIFCRILSGISYSLINGAAYNLVMETTPVKYRSLVSTLIGLPYYISAMLLGLSAYNIRNWRLLHLINSIYVVILPFSVVFLKASPHWLLQKGRIKEANEVIELAYKCNKRNTPPENLFPHQKNTEELNNNTSIGEKDVNKDTGTITSLFKTTKMRLISVVHSILFTFIGFIYYGIPLDANNFTDSPYFYLILIESMEICPSLLGSLIINRLGNINSITILSIIAGICMVAIMICQYWIVDWILIVVAKMSVGLIFLICWILSSELFPTSIRSTGFGMSNFACHFGSLIASYIFDTTARKYPMVPNIISAIFCFLSSFLVRFLPETCGEPLCENISDIEKRKIKVFHIALHRL